MDKRYQVFVSSTYEDLKEERAEVMQALLELDCMPAGMELFPAASEQQWDWIKRVIDESDYYVVIVAGRYGSVSPKSKLSYTEMEYRYAVEAGKPTIAFLHESIDSIPSGRTEKSRARRQKLEDFRAFAEQRLCKYWSNPADLGSKVSRSITQLIKRHPSPGWIRSDQVSELQASELLRLRREVEHLQSRLTQAAIEPPAGIGDLAQGNDEHTVHFAYHTKRPVVGKNGPTYWRKGERGSSRVDMTWDTIFTCLAPRLINPYRERLVSDTVDWLVAQTVSASLSKEHDGHKIEKVQVFSDEFDVIKVQLRALKLVSIDVEGYWELTPYGETRMNELVAVRRNA